MKHNEDEQPNETVRGRPKRIMPFVRDTSRARGRGGGAGSSNFAERGRGRGHGRGRGRGQSQPSTHGMSRGGYHAPSGTLHGHTSYHFGNAPNNMADDNLPPRPHSATRIDDAREGQGISTNNTTEPPMTYSPTPKPSRPRRRRFRPGANNKNPKPHDNPSTSTAGPSGTQQLDPRDTSNSHPAKRPRIDGHHSPSSIPPPGAPSGARVKTEIDHEPSFDESHNPIRAGTKLISYDDHPTCRFNCGKPPNEVRNNRRLLKEQEVSALRSIGSIIDSVFIRDDGIAIDWSSRDASEIGFLDNPPPLVPTFPDGLKPTTPTVLSTAHSSDASPSYLSSKTLLAHLDHLATSVTTSSIEPPPTESSIEIAYREVNIPPRHLPRNGNTRKLEIWALEQMRLLEAELGPVMLPPPELVGIGEYIAGQGTPNGAAPHIRIRYKRPVRVHGFPEEQLNAHSQRVTPIDHLEVPSATFDHSSPSPITSLLDVPLPSIAHLTPLPNSPSPPNSPPPIKDEKDELANNPPSPLVSPDVVSLPIVDADALLEFATNAGHLPSPSGHPRGGSPSEHQGLFRAETQNGDLLTASENDVDELQRLRRDLELSRIEAEKKHRDLERRILQLSEKRSETQSSSPGPADPPAVALRLDHATRIVDDTRSKLSVLRRGKHDKTRRLLKPSDSTVLHVSWLGTLQLIDIGSRKIVATGFEAGAPDSISVEDSCLLSASSTALAITGGEAQLAIATLESQSFRLAPLEVQPHESKGVCTVVPVDMGSVITLGHDHRYFHWRFDNDLCMTSPLLDLPKLHLCTALAFNSSNNNILTAGSDSMKRSKLTLHNLADPQHIPNTVELSNHPHHVHIDPDNPSIFTLELSRLDDQFQVHDLRLPLYQCVQKFGYQNVTLERAEFRVRGTTRGHHFARGDTGIVRLWDRRATQSYQTVPVIPHQRVVETVLDHTALTCATEAHHVITYPTV